MRRIRRNGKNKIILAIVLLTIAFCASVYFIRFYKAKDVNYEHYSESARANVELDPGIYSKDGEYITGILPETTFRDLKNNLNEADIAVYDQNNNRLLYSQYVGTGMRLEYTGQTYKLVVTGDVTGDGKVGISDLVQVKLALIGAREAFVGEYKKAADITGTGTPTISDMIKSNLAIINLLDIIAPNSFVPEVRTTTDSITVTGETVDSNSGIKEYWFQIDGNQWVKNTDPTENTYTFEGLTKATEYSVRMKVVDNEGNIKVTKKVKVRTRSTENADIDIVLSDENWTNQDIMASVYYNANVQGATIEINLNNGSDGYWEEYTGPITVNKNMMIYARVVNEEGIEISDNNRKIKNIDKLDPNPFNIRTTVVNNSITIKVGTDEAPGTTDAIDANGEYECSEIAGYIYQIYNNEWSKTSEQTTDTSYTFENLDEGKEYAIIVTAKDNARNTKQQNDVANSKVTIPESEPTEYTLTINPNGGTYTGETTVTKTEGETVSLNTPTKAGCTFSGWVLINGAGNVNDSDNTYTFGKGNATIKAVWTSNTADDNEAPVIVTRGNPTEWTNKNVDLTIKVIDSSEIKSFTVNGVAKTLTDGEYTFTVYQNGSFEIIAIDNNNNTTTETVVVNKIDKTAPTVTFSQQSNTTLSPTHEVTLTVTEEDSGMYTYKYLWSESSNSPRSEESYTDYFSSGDTISRRGLSGWYYLHVYMKDNAGNVKIARTSGMFYFKYEINNQAELEQFATDVYNTNGFSGKTAYLMADIDLEDDSTFDGIFNFRGAFCGNNHKITGLDREPLNYAYGLFTNNYGTIKDLTLENDGDSAYLVKDNYGTIDNCTFKSNSIEPMCGQNYANGTIKNCKRTGTINQINQDGLGAGITDGNRGTVEGCCNEANVNLTSSEKSIGFAGIVWRNDGKIDKCYNIGNIKVNGTYQTNIGGICVTNYSGRIRYSYNKGKIEGTNGRAGGISAGYEDGGIIEGCYNSGDVSMINGHGAGGISTGLSGYDEIRNCYNTGNISGTGRLEEVGGITGYCDSYSLVQNCYNLGNVTVSGDYAIAGQIVGRNGSEEGGVIRNCYYISGTPVGGGRNEGCTQVTSTQLKNYAGQLDGNSWLTDTSNVNNGYPIPKYVNYNN